MKKFCALLLAILLPACLPCTAPAAAAASEAGTKEIFLTFDDGPTDSVTPLILDVLRQEGVNATFFLIGRQIEGREKTVRRIAAEGHAIGIHTYTHRYKEIYASPAALTRDIRRCRGAIRSALPGFDTTLYRFPGGSFGLSDSLKRAVKNCGLHACDWNAATGDGECGGLSADEQFSNAVRTAAGKSRVILLQHDGVGQKTSAACLPRIIAYFRERGFCFKVLC